MEAKGAAQKVLGELEKAECGKDLIDKAAEVVKSCEDAVDCAQDTMTQSSKPIVDSLNLRSSINESVLLECTVLIQATPKGLSAWVAENEEANEKILDSFLENSEWMRQMILAGGASNGNYGPAIAIHSTLLLQIAADPQPATKVRHKVALATALEHATPISVFRDDSTFIDPVDRFWHYVKAYENGELDSNFQNFSVWELRMTIDSNALNSELTWGRDYLKAYRPDEITRQDFQWKYVWSVRSDVGYRHPDHEFFTYKDLISAGGQCGARAWFGRFICKAWGTPTWGVRQPGHAALSRWTPSGWTTCLGAGFEWSTWDDTRYGQKSRSGLDFEEEAKARSGCCPSYYYTRMGLLECLAECMGETIEEHVHPKKMWRSLSLAERRNLAGAHNDPGAEVTDNNPGAEVTDAYHTPRQVRTEIPDPTFGGIVIPAAAFVEPAKPDNKKVLTMDSIDIPGTKLLHLESDGSVGYMLPAILPSASFLLTTRIVNIHRSQIPLLLTVQSVPGLATKNSQDLEIEVPYTGGEWRTTEPVEVKLVPGSVLRISRDADCHGLTVKDILLQPVYAGASRYAN